MTYCLDSFYKERDWLKLWVIKIALVNVVERLENSIYQCLFYIVNNSFSNDSGGSISIIYLPLSFQ